MEHLDQTPVIQYYHWKQFPGWNLAPQLIGAMVDKYGARRVLEIGAGANPTMSVNEVKDRRIQYMVSDTSEEELRKAPIGYDVCQFDAGGKIVPPEMLESCDLVFSRMVNEHIRDGRQYHSNIYRMLRPGGVAVHCCATLFTLPFLVNRLLPEPVSDKINRLVYPNRDYDGHHGKFRAYYSWCRGPIPRMIQKFKSIGFEIVAFHGYFGHGYYEPTLTPLDRIQEVFTRLLLRNPNPYFCSYVTVTLRKGLPPSPAGAD